MAWRAFKKDPKRHTYTVTGKDHQGVKRQMPAFRDAALSTELAQRLTKLVEYRAHRAPLLPDLDASIRQLPGPMQERLAEWDLLSEAAIAASKSFDQHVED